MEKNLDYVKIPNFLNRIKSEWPGMIDRFEFKTPTVIYVHLKEGISSIDFLGRLSKKVERMIDFTIPIILYHIERDGMNLRSHPINWYSTIR
ncbi:MAG: hypothetical protein ABWZ79_06690 [Pedobacter agri]|uniref:Uncharacterized protein n=1 Tax=Pedobacter agri TaxID=454586 RepID=A0A9X3DJG4_9SPHI|nr:MULTISPECIES: hypothetical protein [Pedobacter]MCX3267345.1 hypothetical protein [Pedobacter agri]MDQ1142568.1 hypothetical protein [Pedobacter agri]